MAFRSSVTEAGDKVSQSDRDAVQSAITALKEVIGGDDVEQIKSKTEALAQVSMKLGEAMYKAQQEAGGPGAGPGRNPPRPGLSLCSAACVNVFEVPLNALQPPPVEPADID